MPSGRAIGVVSRIPTPGNVKTRLAVDLGDEVAATLYIAFLRDTLVAASSMPDTAVSLYHPRNTDLQQLLDLSPPGVALKLERGDGYGEILPSALRDMLLTSPVAALLGADSPGIPHEIIRSAFQELESGVADIAICPASDGGYCLLAVNGDHLGVFQDVDWSTERVCEQTIAKAERLGLRVTLLSAWYDVDRAADLGKLVDDLASNVLLGAAATRAALRSLRTAGVQLPVGERPWRVEERTMVYTTPWRSLLSDRVTTHAGEDIDYAYLETDPAVWVVPVTDDGRIVLVRQYRHPIGEIILEVPAGGGSGDPILIAQRELQEETGGMAREYIHIASYFPAAAHATHEGHVVLALGVTFGAPDLESTELLESLTVPMDLAFDMARRGEIADSQSALAILAAEPAIRAALQR